MPPHPLVAVSSGLVDIGGGELVWVRVYTAGEEGEEEAAGAAARRAPPPPRHSSRRRDRGPLNAAALASLVRSRPAALLLLHGFPDTGELWSKLAPVLASSTGAAVLVPDLPGAGLSAEAERAGASCPEELAAYGVGSLARRMLALLSALGVERAAGVAGHDFGAAIAWRMAMAAPRRVRRLAALSVGHPAAMAAGGARQRARFWYYLFLALSSPPESAERALAGNDFALFKQVISPPLSPRAQRGGDGDSASNNNNAANADAAVDAYAARLARSPRLLRAATNLYRANYRAESFGATEVPAPVPGVTALGGGGEDGDGFEAALGIIGGKDPALTVEQMRASGAFVLPPAAWACEVWPQSGHWMMRDEPERLAGALAALFALACGRRSDGGREEPQRRRSLRARL